MKSRQIKKNNIMNIKLLKSRGSFKRTVTFIEHIESGEKRLGDGELWEYITQKSERSFWVIFKNKLYFASQMSDNSFAIKRTAKLPQHSYSADIKI